MHCDFVERSFFKEQSDYNAYFANAKPGDSMPWADGTLTMGNNGIATYTGPDGNKLSFSRNTKLSDIASRNSYIRAAWDANYGKDCHRLICPFASQEPVIIGHFVPDNKNIIPIYDTESIETGICTYRWYRASHFSVIDLIGKELQAQFPDRKAKRISFLDASDITGICPLHATHNDLMCLSLDIQYFTMGNSNHTQMWSQDDLAREIVKIWGEDGELNAMFDAERNAVFVRMLAEAFPYTSDGEHGNNQILMHSKIRAAILQYAERNMTKEDVGLIRRATRDEDTSSYNHNLHMHLYVGDSINWGMAI